METRIKRTLTETNSKFFKIALIDFAVTFTGAITIAIFKDDITKLDLKIISVIFLGMIIIHYGSNFLKIYLAGKRHDEEKSKNFRRHVDELTKEYGKKFNNIFNHEVRTTIFEEKEEKGKLFLVVASRYNSYNGDPNLTKWEIANDGNHGCKGVVGKAWASEKEQSNSRLSGKDELKRLINSHVEDEREKLKKELKILNMSENELKDRLALVDRKYLFPKMIYAFPVKMRNGKKLVIAVDSDVKNTKFKDEFKKDIELFSSISKRIYDVVDIT